MVAWVTFEKDHLVFTSGEPVDFASSEYVRRSFCGRCGTTLTYEHVGRPEQVDVTLATIGNPGGLRPRAHVWVSNKPDWVVIDDGFPSSRVADLFVLNPHISAG